MQKNNVHLSTASFGKFYKIKEFFLDILFPIHCLLCKKYGKIICDRCLEKIELLEDQVCPYCEKVITPRGKICPACKEKSHNINFTHRLDFLISATEYKNSQINKLVHTYKYNFIQDLNIPLGQILVYSLLQNEIALPDMIVPVPLHKRRLRWRGFNQSELLSNFISRHLTPGLEIPIETSLISRKKSTPPQMKLKRYQERKNNLQNAFEMNPDLDISGKYILLVDDIATTGATLFECAKVLKLRGARKVGAIVLARQEFKKP